MNQMELNMASTSEGSRSIDLSPRVDQARADVERAQQRLADAQRAEEFWTQLSDHWANDRPANALLVIRESGDMLHRLSQAKDSSLSDVESIQKQATVLAQKSTASFGRTFPEAVRNSPLFGQFPIDPTSRHPKYGFASSFLQVEVDERHHTAKISPREGDQMMVGLDVDYLVAKIGAELHRLFGRPLDADSLLKSLYTAYVAVLRAEGRPEGDEVPLKRVSNRLAKNMNRFSADEFNVDLARLVRAGHVDIDGRRMHLNHTRNARQGMLLHGLEEGGYVGFISFKRHSQ